MSRRIEHEIDVKEKLYKCIDGKPEIFREYFTKGAGSQITTKSLFTRRAVRFGEFLTGRGYDIYNVKCWKTVTKIDVEDFLESMKYRTLKDGTIREIKADSVYGMLFSITNFFDFLVRRNYITNNPCPSKEDISSMFKKQTNSKPVVFLNPEQIGHIMHFLSNSNRQMPKRDMCIFGLGCSTGLRAEALSEIDIKDFDFKEMTLTATDKNNETREIWLDDFTMNLVKECIEERNVRASASGTDALFVKKLHGVMVPITKCTITELFNVISAEIGFRLTPHKMRATCITNTYKETGDIYAAARRAGHHNINNTKRYIDASEEDKKAAQNLGTRLFSNC